MKKWMFCLLVVIAIVAPGPSIGEPLQLRWRGSGGWGDKSAYCSLFDAKRVETVQGVVISVDPVTPMPGMSEGIQLQLKTEKETIPVHLGPRWFLENQDFEIKPLDSVEVKGSRFSCENQRVMAASQIRKGDQILELRDAAGHPLWTAAVHSK